MKEGRAIRRKISERRTLSTGGGTAEDIRRDTEVTAVASGGTTRKKNDAEQHRTCARNVDEVRLEGTATEKEFFRLLMIYLFLPQASLVLNPSSHTLPGFPIQEENWSSLNSFKENLERTMKYASQKSNRILDSTYHESRNFITLRSTINSRNTNYIFVSVS